MNLDGVYNRDKELEDFRERALKNSYIQKVVEKINEFSPSGFRKGHDFLFVIFYF